MLLLSFLCRKRENCSDFIQYRIDVPLLYLCCFCSTEDTIRIEKQDGGKNL